MASSPSLGGGGWEKILHANLDRLHSRLEEAKDQQDREDRDATPEVTFSEEILSMEHSFKMECEQLESNHAPDEIETAYEDIQTSDYFYILILHQLLAIAKMDSPGRKTGGIPALRTATECLWAHLGSIGANRKDVRNRIEDRGFWELQVKALKDFQWRKLVGMEYSNPAAVPELTTRRSGRTSARPRGRRAAAAPDRTNRGSRHKSPQPPPTGSTVLKPRTTSSIAKRGHGASRGRVGKPSTERTEQRNHRYELRKYNRYCAT
ncbi:hypothetical protein F4802DRAFT_600965 [Xylaria palmicola]|nr:hypothetical protein F4802DRAFT_600965 [Xylaria palmicola]